MTYKEALAYLYSFSDFERSGKYTRHPEENLPREARLLALLGNPQEQYSTTLIAGTKGKGSTAAYIECVLREAGIRTGLYTQPDLHTFRERMRINGQLISEEAVAQLIPEISSAVEQIQEEHQFAPFITYEVATALAFLYFARQGVQHAVIEVGLGGRLDATNVLQPLVSVITSISYDHMQILGNTLTEIATEKAGIIKQHGIVVTSAQQPEALLAIAAVCKERNARLLRVGASDVVDAALAEVDAGRVPPLSYRYHLEERYRNETRQRFTVRTPVDVHSNLEIPLAGQYQLENAATAVATLELLRERGVVWDERALWAGLRKVHWPARIEVIGREPTLVVDGAHNADSMQKLLEALRASFSMQRLLVVLSVAQDKDIAGIVRELQAIDVVIVTHMHSSRAATIADLQQAFADHAPNVEVHGADDIDAAMQLALTLAGKDDLICATGSLYLAAETLRWAAAHGASRVEEEIEGVDHP